MQDFSTLPDDELFRLNCEVKEAVENRLQKFDPKFFLKMCEQEILWAIKNQRRQATVIFAGSSWLLEKHFSPSDGFYLALGWRKSFHGKTW